MEIKYISKFSSLNFDNEPVNSFEYRGCYIQKFAVGDIIRFQLIVDQNSDAYPSFPDLVLYNLSNNTSSLITDIRIYNTDVGFLQYDVLVMDENSLLIEGIYQLNIRYFEGSRERIIATSFFGVYKETATELLDTVRIDYTHNINEFDTIFLDGDRKAYYTLRVEGGFLGREDSFGNSSNYFRDQYYFLKQTSSLPYGIKSLTIGSRQGVPGWMGERINFIFSLDEVYVNAIRYVRSDSAVPEVNEIVDLYPYYVYKINIEQYDKRFVHDLHPTRTYLVNGEGFNYLLSFQLG